MQNVPSDQSTKSAQQSETKTVSYNIKQYIKVNSDEKTSSTAKQGDETKRPADNTDHTTISSSFCGCKNDRCDAFFDKLLCYLEKQSDIIAKCCAHSREHRRDSTFIQDTKSEHPKDPCKDETLDKFTSSHEMRSKNSSPCKDDQEPTLHRRASVETVKSQKGKSKDRGRGYLDEEIDTKPSIYKSQLDVGEGRQLKLGDRPCNIYVEVCSCQKDGGRRQPSRASQKTLEADSEQYSHKQKSATLPQRQPSGKSNEYGMDCQGCEKKVSHFFKLAEEICQGFMKQCQERNQTQSNHSDKRKNSREDLGNQIPSRPYQARTWNEGNDEYYMKPEKLPAHQDDAYSRPTPTNYHARPIAIEIECQGTKEEFIVEPCRCVDSSYGRGKATPVPSRVESQGPKKSCLDVFEDRYGTILRDIHAKFYPDPKLSPPPGNPNTYGDPKLSPPPGNPNTYGDPKLSPPPGYPNPYGDAAPHQPSPAAPKEESESPPKESKPPEDDDSSDERKRLKKKDKKEDKKKNKKKGSKDS